jgi:hypothetical protein
MAKSRNKFKCLDCLVDTGRLGEHFFLKNEVWFKVHTSDKGMICIGCIEARLGRKLVPEDFTDAYVNRPVHVGQTMSDRLRSRLGINTKSPLNSRGLFCWIYMFSALN